MLVSPFSFVLFVSTNNLGGPYDQTDISFFEENNIILLQEDGSYIVNPIMANQSLNELTSCVSFLTSVEMPLTDGQTMENFCKGTGTASNGYTFQENLNNDDFFSEEVLTYFEENNIITSKIENLPYFEFTISGKNTYEKEDIWYDVVLMHGDEHATRTTRIRDDLLKFALVEVGNNEEKIIFSNRFYENLNNKRIHVETIKANTLDVVNKTYRLYMWIDENTIIGNVNQDYTMEEWEDVFASIKVGVTGDFVEKFIYTEERCFEYLPNIYSDDQIIGVSIINYDETCGSDVVIPKTIDGYNVMVINSEAFGSKNKGKGLTSVVIPDSVGEIGYYAFANNKLTSIKLSDNLYFIDESAFAANQLTSVEIPDNVYTIGKFAFGSNLLEKVTIGKNVNDIGEGAFGINFGYGMYDNPINTIVNKSGNVFDWNAVLGIGVYADSDNTFATGTIKYNGPYGETEILVTSE